MFDIRRSIVEQIEAAGGRHDEPAIYGGEPGDPGIGGGPGSISWEINGDLASLVVGGTAAIIMEVLHPSVMAGVYTQSSYRTQPLQRARNTLGYVLRTTFGTTAAATDVIERVKKIHSRVGGQRPDGLAYQALDPELIGWVHTCIPWLVMRAFETYNRPLSVAEKDRYLAEQAVIGRMGGADWVPTSVAELDDYVERMRPQMAMTYQTVEFLGFLAGRTGEQPVTRRERFDRWVGIRSSMGLVPEWARRMTGTYKSPLAYRFYFGPNDRLKAKVVRWAYPELPCKAMAIDRVAAKRPALVAA
ncbi:MAG: oxygenase MpaB family protein [Candidatus Binatia bacterium]